MRGILASVVSRGGSSLATTVRKATSSITSRSKRISISTAIVTHRHSIHVEVSVGSVQGAEAVSGMSITDEVVESRDKSVAISGLITRVPTTTKDDMRTDVTNCTAVGTVFADFASSDLFKERSQAITIDYRVAVRNGKEGVAGSEPIRRTVGVLPSPIIAMAVNSTGQEISMRVTAHDVDMGKVVGKVATTYSTLTAVTRTRTTEVPKGADD